MSGASCQPSEVAWREARGIATEASRMQIPHLDHVSGQIFLLQLLPSPSMPLVALVWRALGKSTSFHGREVCSACDTAG